MRALPGVFWRCLRQHLHFIIIAPLIICVMTYPTIVHVFDASVFWLPTKVYDVWINISDAWHFERFLAGESELFFSDLIFHPDGVSLDYRNLFPPYSAALNLLRALMPVSNAYNLLYLLLIFITALSAYVYLLYLLQDKWISLFGALIFGCGIYVIARPSQPMVSMIATIPLTFYFWQRALLERRWFFAAITGLVAGVTVFIGVYTYIILMLALGFMSLWHAAARWREREFWLRLALALTIAGGMGLARYIPLLRDSDDLAHSLRKGGGGEVHTDLALHFVNTDHPILSPLFRSVFGVELAPRWNSSYFGYTALILAAFSFVRCGERRKLLFWLYLALPFLLLRLGSFLTVNGHEYRHIVLPKAWLDDLLPSIFGAIYSPDYFYCGALMSLAVLACYGLRELLRLIPRRRHRLVLLVCIGLVAFENYTSPDSMILPEAQTAYLKRLAQEENQDAIHLINLPMGRVPSKLYDYFLMISGYPHAEGTAGRTPDRAYDYIRGNFVLNAWREQRPIQCRLANQADYLAALDQLEGDDFSHVIHHKGFWNSAGVAASFAFVRASYEDEHVAMYGLGELRASCPDNLPSQAQAQHLRAFFQQSTPTPRRNELILSLHGDKPLDATLMRYYASEAQGWQGLAHVYGAEAGARMQSADGRYSELERMASDTGIVWLVYDPRQTDPAAVPGFSDTFASRYRLCHVAHAEIDMAAARYIPSGYECALVDVERSLGARYDNGIVLADSKWRIHEGQLRIDLWFSEFGNLDFAYALQIFNESGDKQAQVDHHLGADALASINMDLSHLSPGAYVAKLILYDRESLESQPGVRLPLQERFERELEIARFAIAE